MRFPVLLLALSACFLGGCGAVLLEGAAGATYPLDKKGALEEAQHRYTSNIRFGLFEEAKPFVEPELEPYGQELTPEVEAPIPRHDLPFGMPDWHGVGSRTDRSGAKKIVWTAP